MKRTALFPGQGPQFVGMGKDLFSKEAESIFIRANKVLGYDLKKLCFEGPEDVLNQTEFSQPAVVAVSFAKFVESGMVPDMVAGQSLGEYTAVCAAGCIDFEEAVWLVQERGRLMTSSDGGRGAMAILGGLNRREAQKLCEDCGIVIASVNCHDQFVLSGMKEGIVYVLKKAAAAGKRGKILPISCAAHSPLMEAAQVGMAKTMQKIKFRNPSMPIVTNATGDICMDGEEMKRLLVRQLVRPVEWERSVQTMLKEGVEEFSEFGPKDVLSKLVEKIRARFVKKD